MSDAETTSDEGLAKSNDRSLNRQERKQLDRKVPWREIMKLPAMDIDAYVQAAEKEFDGWMKWNAVRPLSDSEARQIWKDPKLRRRILKSRAAYRDKNRGLGALKAKCRVVLIGCADPDLRQLSRDSQTPSRLS